MIFQTLACVHLTEGLYLIIWITVVISVLYLCKCSRIFSLFIGYSMESWCGSGLDVY